MVVGGCALERVSVTPTRSFQRADAGILPTPSRVDAWSSRAWRTIAAIVFVHNRRVGALRIYVEAVKHLCPPTLVLRTSDAECRR
jgi:hypothetical protein